jgi:uncharacterized protein YecT (DUF1311 family)
MRWLVGIVVAGACAGAGHAATPSFDCARAATWSEKTICGDEGLAMLDREMAAAFATRQSEVGDIGREQVLADQRAWLAIRDECRDEGDPVGCLTGRYRDRIRQLLGLAPARGGVRPEERGALGECRREASDAAAVGLCLDRKLAAATAAFGDAEAAMLQRLASRAEVAGAFRESQEAFLRFRDGTCRWRSALDGHDEPDLRQACLVDFTRARTAEIEGLLR